MLASWAADDRGHDALDTILAQNKIRVPELVPIRHYRMAASPLNYYRGAAAVMAADLAAQPNSGLTVQLCGDAHVLNFGLWATPERNLSFDLRDFDETLPGPFEWDVKRFATSLVVAARDNGLKPATAAAAVTAGIEAYCRRMRRYTTMTELDIWYDGTRVDSLIDYFEPADRGLLGFNVLLTGNRPFLEHLDAELMRSHKQLNKMEVRSLSLDFQEQRELESSYNRCLQSVDSARDEIQKLDPSIKFLCTGGFQHADSIAGALRDGACDGVSIARPLVANNDLPHILRTANGPERQRECTYCNKCLLNDVANPLGCYELCRYDGDCRTAQTVNFVHQVEPLECDNPDFQIVDLDLAGSNPVSHPDTSH